MGPGGQIFRGDQSVKIVVDPVVPGRHEAAVPEILAAGWDYGSRLAQERARE